MLKGHNYGLCRVCGKEHIPTYGMLGKKNPSTRDPERNRKISEALRGRPKDPESIRKGLAVRAARLPSVEERFFARVEKTEGCWIWRGNTNDHGYGRFSPKRGVFLAAHRYSYELAKGSIPEGLTIDHLCRNTLCVRPEHLEAVTLKENLSRGTGFPAVNAKKTHCIHGHALTPDNLMSYGLKHGKRVCRACALDAKRRYNERRRA